MKVALTEWEGRISPLFDSARTLLIADIERGRIAGTQRAFFESESGFSRAARLDELGVDVLICGGISDCYSRLIEGRKIRVISFAAGSVDEVLDAYMEGILLEERFRMPGCGTVRTSRATEDD